MATDVAQIKGEWAQAKDGFVAELEDGRQISIRRGDHIRARHPAVQKYPQLFEPLTSRHDEVGVEDMAAEPGRKRGARAAAQGE